MKLKTTELQGAALDWAVTLAEYPNAEQDVWRNFRSECHYSTDWAQGGPIIEREKISVMFSYELGIWVSAIGELWVPEEGGIQGLTPLIAAMRCFVASKMGDDVEITEELI